MLNKLPFLLISISYPGATLWACQDFFKDPVVNVSPEHTAIEYVKTIRHIVGTLNNQMEEQIRLDSSEGPKTWFSSDPTDRKILMARIAELELLIKRHPEIKSLVAENVQNEILPLLADEKLEGPRMLFMNVFGDSLENIIRFGSQTGDSN